LNSFFLTFFNYPYLFFSADGLIAMSPLIVAGILINVFAFIQMKSSSYDEKLLKTELQVSTLAGIWEEIGYRWLLILTSMIALMFFNWFIGSVLVWIFIVLFIALSFGSILLKDHMLPVRFLFSIFFMAFAFWFFFLWSNFEDPIYWLNEAILIPIIDFVTFGLIHNSVLYNDDLPSRLFLYGAIAANAKFRDGHKYQGFLGYVNSWFLGLDLLHCAIIYGLITAIAIHSIYNISIHTISYLTKKIQGRFGRKG